MFSPNETIGNGIAAVIALTGVAPPASAHIGITTQNIYRGLTPAHARHDVRQAAGAGSVVFAQEMFTRHARRLRPAGWAAAHMAGPYRGDCAVFYRRAVWRLRAAYVVPLTNAPTRLPSNGHRRAIVAVLTGRQTWAGVCVHMPTQHAPTAAYAAGVRRLRALLARLSARFAFVAVGGDWNRGYWRRPRLPGFVAARPPRATGPHGGRVDYVYVRRPARIARVRDIGHTYSDHNGVRIWAGTGRHG